MKLSRKRRVWGQLGGIRIIHHDNSLPEPEKSPGKSRAKHVLGARRITLAHGISQISVPKNPFFSFFAEFCDTGM